MFVLFCVCSSDLNAHEGEEHDELEILSASSLEGVWRVNNICFGPVNGASLNSSLKFHAAHDSHVAQAPSKLILSFCSDEDENLFGVVKNQNRLDAEARYEVTNSILDNGATSFAITAESENTDLLDFEITEFDLKTHKRFNVSFDEGECRLKAKRRKSKPSRACKLLLPVGSIAE